MSDLALFSHILLWLGFAALVIVNLAMLRQFGVLFERVAPAGALAMNTELAVDDTAPQLALTSLAGDNVTIGAPRPDAASTLLFFLSPDCVVCKSLLPIMAQLNRQWKHIQFYYASAGEDVQAHETYIQAHDLPRSDYLISDQLGMAYGVSKLPYAVLINPKGRISAFGLVNTREHLESLLEAQRMNVASLQDFIHQQGKAEEESHAG